MKIAYNDKNASVNHYFQLPELTSRRGNSGGHYPIEHQQK